MPNNVLVSVDDVTKRFDKTSPPALENITLSLPKGKLIGLVGPDAAGKTTLIRLMTGLLTPSSGTIEVSGDDTIRDASKIHNIIGYMPQKFGLYEDLTVMENLTLYADLQGVSSTERIPLFERLLTFTSLKPFTERLAKHLSGGMKQKLGLACALLRTPQFLVLDEPSVGVDPYARRELWSMVAELKREGITVLWSTSYLDEAEKCEEVILLHEGKVLYFGKPSELTHRMKGRTFQLQDITNDRRQVLTNVLKHKDVLDGVIQGSAVRVVYKTIPIKLNPSEFDAGPSAHLIAVEPRFEDAYIDILGGGPGAYSHLAERAHKIKEDHSIVIEAKNLTKRFGTFTAANNISFDVRRGEIFGLLGPNGAGKSTTFKMLCGLLPASEGSSHVTGLSMQAAPSEARSRIGYMAQKFSLYGNLTVWQNLNFFSGIYPVVKNQRVKIIDDMVANFGLTPYLNKIASELPLGLKQRLALACAVMHHPEVLFLDEPTSGVDPVTRREFWSHINGLVGKGVTVMVTTHFMDEAEYCDRIGLINRGKLIVIGSPDELKNSVKSKDTPLPTLEDAFILLSQQEEKV